MILPWSPVIVVDIVGSLAMLLLSCWCAVLARQLSREKPDDIFRNYLFLFTLAVVCFAISRSFGHLVKQLLLLNDQVGMWRAIAPYSGAVNSATFVVIFAFGIYFHRFQKVHSEIEYYKNNLEKMVAVRTKQLEKSKNTLENILNNSNPICITSTDFELVQANEAYSFYWPLVVEGNLLKKCYESRPGKHCHTEDCPLQLILEGADEVVQEVTKNIRGEELDFLITAKPFRDIDGKLIGMVESFMDITLRKKAERALVEMDRIKSEFISTAAHELNTPLSAILGYAEFLRKPEEFGEFTEEQKRGFVNEIFERGESLHLVIDDLLDITRIESGSPLPLALKKIDLRDLLDKKVRLFLPGNQHHVLRLDMPTEVRHQTVLLDRHRINQALDNLLNNAVKYSPDGGEIVVTAREKDDHWEIRVSDHGIGMTPEQVEHVFDKFYRGDTSDTAVSGLGLGMSVVRQVVEMHRGTISVESSLGKGTAVTFTLPFDPGE